MGPAALKASMSLVHSVLGTGDSQVPFLLRGQCASGFQVWEEAVLFQAGVGHGRLSACSHRWLTFLQGTACRTHQPWRAALHEAAGPPQAACVVCL